MPPREAAPFSFQWVWGSSLYSSRQFLSFLALQWRQRNCPQYGGSYITPVVCHAKLLLCGLHCCFTEPIRQQLSILSKWWKTLLFYRLFCTFECFKTTPCHCAGREMRWIHYKVFIVPLGLQVCRKEIGGRSAWWAGRIIWLHVVFLVSFAANCWFEKLLWFI